MNLADQLLGVKNIDAYPRAIQKNMLERLTFDYIIRHGTVPSWLITMQKLATLSREGVNPLTCFPRKPHDRIHKI